MIAIKQRGHQGDVQFKELDRLPDGAIPVNQKPLALGEHSGHQHVITGDVQLFEHDGRVYAAVGKDGATLNHVHISNFKGYAVREQRQADHKPAHFKPNSIIEFGIHKRYNPFSKVWEQIKD